MRNMKNILVAIDGSEVSKRALVEARDLAECEGSKIKDSKVKIIHVRNDASRLKYVNFASELKDQKSHLENEEKHSELLLDESLKTFQDFPGEVKTVSQSGDPAEEIMKEAEKENHDLIIMGSRGLGTFSRTILGSVTNKVLNHSNKRILIIR